MEEILLRLILDYGYYILFIWSIMEGELGLVMAGILSYTGDMNIFYAILVAGLGGFTGDQIFFYIGRFNRNYVQKKFSRHRRKFAMASLLLNKYGWYIIFIQRYMYGLRTIIPITIGTTKLSWKKFAIINLISAFIWASITIVLAYWFGDYLLAILHYLKKHWYVAFPTAGLIFYLVIRYIKKAAEKRSFGK
ncbi:MULTISPECIES: DedA family protein [Calditerrivibrio]|jgi:membrane protein DedA with SNARE-associated domain|uniref:DedA family protein n=1 Tax=Calditerrivibrio nitroreducens TaxID=477976 RepID=A0A2J6WQP2_9BACT|nr:MAG: DedA family protein [Calditerrivibrio nitroreducens]